MLCVLTWAATGMNSIRRDLYLVCVLALAGCGLKGPLYLPAKSGAQHAPDKTNASRSDQSGSSDSDAPVKTQPPLPDASQTAPGAEVSNPPAQSQRSRR